MTSTNLPIGEFVEGRNAAKKLFTAGPASLLAENLTGLRPCFGRGDDDYSEVEENVLESLRDMTGHRRIVRLQGSASLALEIMALNYLYGRVLVVQSGYYSQRLHWLATSALRRLGAVKEVVEVDWDHLDQVEGSFDWVVACSTETSCGLKLPMESLHSLARRLSARLMLDATASVGLESGHEVADVLGYSSCKGLLGLTGAAFIAYNEPAAVEVDSFYLSMATHESKGMTGPYHAICSLAEVLPRHDDLRSAIVENKRAFQERFRDSLTFPPHHQPLLCTHVSVDISSRDPSAVLYRPRSDVGGSVVCHLGEAHLGRQARGDILDALHIESPPPGNREGAES